MEEILTNQTPINQPVQINQSQPLSSNNKNNPYKILFFLAIIVLLGVTAGFYFIFNNKTNQLTNNQLNNQKTSEISPSSTIIPTSTLAPIQTQSTLTEKDSSNYLYTNNKFGFSLVVPKTFASDKENCKKVNDSYQTFISTAPVTFFEGDDTFYFGGKYFYRLIGEQKIPVGNGDAYNTKFSGCQKEEVTLTSIQDNSYTTVFKFYAANVENDSELESYIKSKYGSGCKLGEKTSSSSDTYSVKILGDGKELGETQCPINFMVDVEYNPTKGKVVIFELGQACNFNKEVNSTTGKCTALDMVKSLKFN